jgi:GNAT superfamily N-acetyltransferase
MGDDAARRRLNWIMLDPRFQGHGAGRAIMERVAARAVRQGIQVVDIAASHKSEAFFARFGAVTMTVTPDGWGSDMHRVDMELRLPRKADA